MSALAAVERIRTRHKAVDAFDVYNQPIEACCGECSYAVWPCATRADAGVAASGIREAITHLEAQLAELWEGPECDPTGSWLEQAIAQNRAARVALAGVSTPQPEETT